jgi:outer membrane lipoprotein-sorting protein
MRAHEVGWRSAAPAVAAAVFAVLYAAGSAAAVPTGAKRTAQLSSDQIVDKNVAARGGLDAWRKIDSMVWMGHLESADPNMPRLSFTLKQKRPNKERFELSEIGQKSMRVFDGNHGWRVKPNRDGSLDAQPYSPQDLEFAREAQGIDGPLVDYKAKGITVESVSVEKIDGRKTYRLHVKSPGGELHDVWVDAKTFLDVKYDRTSIRATGDPGVVSVVYRDYKTVEGLQIPSILEIGGGGGKPPARMVIEKIALNPPLDDKIFTKPKEAHRSRMATVDMTPPAPDPRQAFGRMAMPGIGSTGPGPAPQ